MALKEEAWRLDPGRYATGVVLQTRYGDMDSNRHLNNVALARLLEEARVRLHWRLRAAGAEPAGAMLVHAAIDYLAEGDYPQDVLAGASVVAVGRTSWRLAIGLFQQGRAIVLADCVMVHAGGGAALPVGAALRTALEALGPR